MAKVDFISTLKGDKKRYLSFDDISIQDANKILVILEGEVEMFEGKAEVGTEISTAPKELNKQVYTIKKPKPASKNYHVRPVYLNHVKSTVKVDDIIEIMKFEFFVDENEKLVCTKAGLRFDRVRS